MRLTETEANHPQAALNPTLSSPNLKASNRFSLNRYWIYVQSYKTPNLTRKFKIANGRSIDLEGEWPWLSMLIKEGSEDQYDAQVQCVGVLINCNTVLTTASCAKHSQGLFLLKISTLQKFCFMPVELNSVV